MTLPPFKTIGLLEPSVSRFQEHVSESFGNVEDKDIIDGRLIASYNLITGVANMVPHGLQRTLLGYIVVRQSVDCRIWDDELTNTMGETFVNLRTSANVTVSLWVF